MTALKKACNALLLKLAALILALSQSAGTSFGLVQPISTVCHAFQLVTTRELTCVLSCMHI